MRLFFRRVQTADENNGIEHIEDMLEKGAKMNDEKITQVKKNE